MGLEGYELNAKVVEKQAFYMLKVVKQFIK
jgi:hypothetical protein